MLPIYFSSADAGAPSLNNAAGSLLEVLRACLVTGYNARTVSSIVVASEVATATIATHGYTSVAGKRVLIAGAPDAGLNGVVLPTSVTTNTVVYGAPGVADGTYTGTITAKRAPLDWEESHTGTNVAIFSRTDPEATTLMLRVLDTAAAPCSATSARCFSVESASDVATYSGQGPTQVQLANGQYIWKGSNSATAKSWAIVGDSRFFYLFVESVVAGAVSVMLTYFGDPIGYQSVDPYACLVGGNTADSGVTSNAVVSTPVAGQPTSYGSAWARVSSLSGEAVPAGSIFLNWQGSVGSSGPTAPLDGSFPFVRPVFVSEANAGSGNPVRAEMPGLSYPLGKDQAASFALITPAIGEPRTHLFMRVGGSLTATVHVMVDLTGPWRE